MINTVLTFIFVFMEMIFLDISADTFFAAKSPVRPLFRYGRLIIIAAVITVNVFLFGILLPARILANSLLAFLYLSFFYKASIPELFGVLMFYYSIIVSTDFIGMFIFKLSESEHQTLYYCICFMAKCAEVGIGLLARGIWKKKNSLRVLPRGIWTLLLSSGIVVWTGLFAGNIMIHTQDVPKEIVLLMCGIIGMNIFSFLYLLLAAGTEFEKSSLREAAKADQMQLEIYKNKQTLYAEQGKRLHEYKNQLLSISLMLENEPASRVREYIESLTGSIIKELDRIDTGHPAANAILNTKKQEALDSNIKINFLCSDLKHILLNEDEIIILLGNLLDNAIEAAKKQEADRMIQAAIIQEEDQLTVTVKNTYAQPLDIADGKITSSKQDKEAHGYGIEAIRRIAEKYDGMFVIKKDGNFVKATVIIPNS